MAKHEFGIMPQPPTAHEQFIKYEPWKYNCISVDDVLIEPIFHKLASVDCYWHTVDCPAKGLDYCGISLIPPESIAVMLQAIHTSDNLQPLKELLQQAKEKDKFVIHFGI